MAGDPIYSKRDVSYRKSAKGADEGECGNCRFFQPIRTYSKPGLCDLVKGGIDNTYTCNLWAAGGELIENGHGVL